jgi:hypothetical protein
MGNPAILNNSDRARSPASIRHDSGRQWRVYKLRSGGAKLSRNAIVETEQQGVIIIQPLGRAVHAELTGEHGVDLARLENVRIRRMFASGAILLHGTELHQTRRDLVDQPQAWWCVPCGE